METAKEFVARLNATDWNVRHEVSPEAAAVIEEAVSRLRSTIRDISLAKGIGPTEAHMLLETAGCNAAEYKVLINWIADRLDTTNAGMREPLILNIAAAYSWHLESEFADVPNPWEPLLTLYLMGYPARIACDEETEAISMIVSLGSADSRSYSIV